MSNSVKIRELTEAEAQNVAGGTINIGLGSGGLLVSGSPGLGLTVNGLSLGNIVSGLGLGKLLGGL